MNIFDLKPKFEGNFFFDFSTKWIFQS